MADRDIDIAVVGAGLVGLAFARAVRDASIAVLSPEPPQAAPAPDAPFGARIYAISPGNVAFLRALRVWQRIPEARVAPVYSMQVHGDDGRAQLAFDAYRAGVDALAWIVEDAALQAALWQALDDREHCERRVGAQCAALETDGRGVRLRLEDGGTLSAGLAVGADGAHSPLRAMAGIAVRARPYGQSAVVANFDCERRHDNVAHQWFQGGPILALLPLPGERVSMVWSLPERDAERLLASPPDALCGEVEQASGGVLGGLSLVGTPRAFALQRLAAQRLVADRLVLIGDAAHVVHPLAGQGANLGLQDARTLAGVLAERAPVHDIGSPRILRRYERARAEPILAMDAVVNGLYGLFRSPDLGVARLRNCGLNLTERLPVVKNLLMRRAMS